MTPRKGKHELDSVKVFIVSNRRRVRRPLFRVPQIEDRLRYRGVGEVYAATFGPKVIGRMIEDCLRGASSGAIRSRSIAVA